MRTIKRIVSEVLELLGDLIVPMIVTVILATGIGIVVWLLQAFILPKE